MNELLQKILNGEPVAESIENFIESKFKGSGKRIDFEDQLVRVYDGDGNEIYSGMEDYEPMKDEAWWFDSKLGAYVLDYNGEKFIKNAL